MKYVSLLFALFIFLGSCAEAPLQLEPYEGPGGAIAPKATAAGFSAEVDINGKAGRLFTQAETHFAANRFKEATTFYRQSIQHIPTLAAQLNLGIALLSMSDMAAATQTLTEGLSQKPATQGSPFHRRFLGNLGNAYANQNSLRKALDSFEETLKIYREIDQQAELAASLGNIGMVYFLRSDLRQRTDRINYSAGSKSPHSQPSR